MLTKQSQPKTDLLKIAMFDEPPYACPDANGKIHGQKEMWISPEFQIIQQAFTAGLLRFDLHMFGGKLIGDEGAEVDPAPAKKHLKDKSVSKQTEAAVWAARQQSKVFCQMAIRQLEEHIQGLVFSAFRMRKITMGTEATLRAIRSGRGLLVIMANDYQSQRKKVLREVQQYDAFPVYFLKDKETWGKCFRRESVGVFCLEERNIVQSVINAAEKIKRLTEEA